MRVTPVALLMSSRVHRNEGAAIEASLRDSSIESVVCHFCGECSLEEIEAHARTLTGTGIDCVLAAGGGKCVDAGKAIAHRLDAAVVIVSTLASNDAPCSALSVLYTPHGVSSAVEFYPQSPAFVIVDTEVIATAPERYLVAGMGDAMATWYEADACRRNPAAVTAVGARATLASCTIGEACARSLYEHGVAAAAAVRGHGIDDALETVVEANTLLSGLGFESGGVAVAHGIAMSYTALPKVHANYPHGEMVAMGRLTQLVLEERFDGADRIARLFAAVGLPIHLQQISLDRADRAAIATIVDRTLAFSHSFNMPIPVTADRLQDAVLDADSLGRTVARSAGDAPYRRLQNA